MYSSSGYINFSTHTHTQQVANKDKKKICDRPQGKIRNGADSVEDNKTE